MLKDFLINSVRLTGERKPILVVDPSKFEEFIKAIATTTEIDEPYRTLLATLVTGGLRVTEGLTLRKKDFFTENGLLYFKSNVLKKGSKLKRTCLVHPAIQNLVQKKLDQIKHHDLLFPYHRKTVWRIVKQVFGDDACPHSVARHSYISWLIHEKKVPALEAARVVELKVSTIEAYNHPNVKARLNNLYGAA